MADLLVILNPRHIPECIESFEALPIDKAWLTGYTEMQLVDVFPELPEYDRYIVASDDCIVSPEALAAVQKHLDDHPVVTGYCSLARDMNHLVNICKRPLPDDPIPRVDAYHFYHRLEAQTWPHPVIPTSFAGMCLTGMSRELWQRFPFNVTPLGGQSDYSLSQRLQAAGVPIVAAREGMVTHCKERWNQLDTAPEKRLLVGQVEPQVRLEHGRLAQAQP